MKSSPHICVVTVNHNSSMFAELMLRTMRRQHPSLSLDITVIDNNSTDTDELQALKLYTGRAGVAFATSGFTVEPNTPNSHGESLRNFVLEHPDCSHYLFVDPDVYFLSPRTIDKMLADLDADESAFGIMPNLIYS